ncbi:MAG: penicillin-binding protein 2 [Armatimonadetes bacterium]|nr:penicillin-binding protein 2 [Armatimonadota bacterium]
MEHPGPDDLRFITEPLLRLSRYRSISATFRPADPVVLRAYIVAGVLLGFLLVVFGRVAHLQLFKYARLEALEGRVHQSFRRPAGPPGDILDSYGRVVATSEPAWAVKINPCGFRRLVPEGKEREAAIKHLAQALGQPEARVREVVNQDRTWGYLARYVTTEVKERVREAAKKYGIPHITFDPEYRRVYPLKTAACHVVGWRGPDQTARTGLEAAYSFVLDSQPGSARGATDKYGRHVPWPDRGRPYPGREGRCLVTTLDIDIQQALESALDSVYARYRPDACLGIVMEAKTGGVLAMAARPNYDPASFGRSGKGRRRASEEDIKNPCTQRGFEPGSAMKPFVVAAALEEGLVSESDHFFCDGALSEVGGPPIHCAHGARHGTLTLTEVIAKSCNVSAGRIALRVGGEKLLEWLRRFGFGQAVGIELPEALGLLPPAPGHPCLYKRDVACLGFGQGMSATLIQLAAAYCALANDGVYMLPHMVRRIVSRDGSVFREIEPVRLRRVCSVETSRRVRAMLQSVVEHGTGTNARIPGVAVGGKTGTAQRPKPGGGFEGYIASFVMVLPIDDPRYVIAIVVDNPHGGQYGGSVAAPAVRDVALAILRTHGEIPVQMASAAR